MAYEQELAFLEDIRLRKPESISLEFPDWNEAVSMKARLDKAVKDLHGNLIAGGRQFDLPFEGLSIRVMRPRILRFTWGVTNWKELPTTDSTTT